MYTGKPEAYEKTNEEYNYQTLGLYIHIPFCKAKCNYCDFNSFPCKEAIIPEYFTALKKEVELYSKTLEGNRFKTVFIGGGTPSLVEPGYIYEIVKTCRQHLNIIDKAEISIETNPGTLTYEKLSSYKAMGINRLSIGLQAAQDRLLKFMGRIHTVEEFIENYELAGKIGFKNINLDLIFGIPGQTEKDWEKTLDLVLRLEPRHISCYSLKIEEGTTFGKRLECGELIPVEDELDRDMYNAAIYRFNSKGYKHYEISNFSKPGYECRHNLVYWKAGQYVGIGAGAHSYFNDERYNNIYRIEDYITKVMDNMIPAENREKLDNEDEMAEFVILGLRLLEGINGDEFKARFGKDLFEAYGKQFKELIRKELLEQDGKFIRLSPLGLDLANQVFVEFV